MLSQRAPVLREGLPPEVNTSVTKTMVRMAEEGMPVAAIARSLALPSDLVWTTLQEARDAGWIINLPKPDWTPGSKRAERSNDDPFAAYGSEELRLTAMRTFRLTPSEAGILVDLLRRNESKKEHLHAAMRKSSSSETDPKIVDVMICKMRKKMPKDIKIQTIWGEGYCIDKDGKARALELMKAQNFTAKG